jgi:hypothetical protein
VVVKKRKRLLAASTVLNLGGTCARAFWVGAALPLRCAACARAERGLSQSPGRKLRACCLF